MIITIVVFVAILALLVFAHEIGHFIAAKRAGIKIEEFGLGIPPRIIGFTKNPLTSKWQRVGLKTKETKNTIYSLNWVPLGGFVKIRGEQGGDSNDPESFVSKGVGNRAWILSSGVLMNILLTVILLSVGFMFGLPQVVEDQDFKGAKITNEKILIIDTLAGLPAQREGLQLGDILISIDGKEFKEIKDLQNYLNQKTEQEILMVIERGGKKITKEITLEKIPEINQNGLGVVLVKTGTVSFPWYLALWQGVLMTLFLFKAIILALFYLIKELLISHQVAIEIAGPVGIAVLTGQVTKMGFIYILQFTALLSLNLAIINFLPFPALDGGRVLFLIIEKVRGKAVNQKLEALIHNLGFISLMILILLVTFRDIARVSEKFSNFLSKLLGG